MMLINLLWLSSPSCQRVMEAIVFDQVVLPRKQKMMHRGLWVLHADLCMANTYGNVYLDHM